MADGSGPFSIREAGQEDAAAILGCLRAAFEAYRERYTRAAFLDTVLTVETLEERLREMTLFVAVDSAGHVVGTIGCGFAHCEAHLRGMAVHPECQGNGVAMQLLSRAEGEARARKCTHISLDTTEPLERAMRFYERNGYRKSGRVSDFFGMRLWEYVKSVEA